MPIGNDVVRANRKYEGQTCSICKREINLGDFIHICPKCQSVNHEECWNKEGGCINFSCNSLSSQTNSNFNNRANSNFGNQQNFNQNRSSFQNPGSPARPSGGIGLNTNSNNQNMVPCRFCKEPIMRGARKCKHCGEYQNESDRMAQQQSNQNFSDGDTNLSVTDWIGILCCPIIGIIQSVIYFIQGKTEKGKKLLVGCIISMVIGGVLRALSKIN